MIKTGGLYPNNKWWSAPSTRTQAKARFGATNVKDAMLFAWNMKRQVDVDAPPVFLVASPKRGLGTAVFRKSSEESAEDWKAAVELIKPEAPKLAKEFASAKEFEIKIKQLLEERGLTKAKSAESEDKRDSTGAPSENDSHQTAKENKRKPIRAGRTRKKLEKKTDDDLDNDIEDEKFDQKRWDEFVSDFKGNTEGCANAMQVVEKMWNGKKPGDAIEEFLGTHDRYSRNKLSFFIHVMGQKMALEAAKPIKRKEPHKPKKKVRNAPEKYPEYKDDEFFKAIRQRYRTDENAIEAVNFLRALEKDMRYTEDDRRLMLALIQNKGIVEYFGVHDRIGCIKIKEKILEADDDLADLCRSAFRFA
jgi:hypothetical protein